MLEVKLFLIRKIPIQFLINSKYLFDLPIKSYIYTDECKNSNTMKKSSELTEVFGI